MFAACVWLLLASCALGQEISSYSTAAETEAARQKQIAEWEAGNPKSKTPDFKIQTWYAVGLAHSTEAAFVECNETTVKLRKKDGSAVNVPLAKLSPSSRDSVKEHADQLAESLSRQSKWAEEREKVVKQIALTHIHVAPPSVEAKSVDWSKLAGTYRLDDAASKRTTDALKSLDLDDGEVPYFAGSPFRHQLVVSDDGTLTGLANVTAAELLVRLSSSNQERLKAVWSDERLVASRVDFSLDCSKVQFARRDQTINAPVQFQHQSKSFQNIIAWLVNDSCSATISSLL
ncbi:SHD1 domain-containing protein [Rhodopirellula bahusiensis]|uniref:SHD1 domain-containing protein n=1 Tax=Rhodopirellula bahusiensis TaxID=2014065 RepID=UPI003299DE5B